MADNNNGYDDDHQTGDEGVLPPVAFSFTTFSGWEADDWKVRSFELREEVQRPYVLELEVITDDVDVDDAALMGAECELLLDRGDGPRSIPGIILSVRVEAIGGDRLGLKLVIGPALALLAHREHVRVFPGRSVPEVVAEVVAGLLAHHDRGYRFAFDPKTYQARHILTQHGESDLEFLERILAEEGIYYHFEAEGGRERVVFADMSQQAPALSFGDASALPLVTRGSGASAKESLSTFSMERAVAPTSAASIYWRHEEADQPPTEASRGDVDDPAALAIVDHAAPNPLSLDDAARCARLNLEAAQAAAACVRAVSDAIHLACGQRFEVSGHPQPGCDRAYFVTCVIHRGDAPDIQTHGDADARPRYSNKVVCIPDSTPYRPPRPTTSRRRTIATPQVAIVVGPEGEEIHTDELGRILVRFIWDCRPPAEAEARTFWVRVVQPWAGAGFGCQFIPRVGTEVMVNFLNGDPDQPVVTGCFYNSHQSSPFTLPAEKALCGIRSDSSPGGGGCNELIFDDTKGSEQLRLRAERDQDEHVSNDRHRHVGRDERVEIDRDRTHTISGADNLNVGGALTLDVEGTMQTTVKGMCEVKIEEAGYYVEVKNGGVQVSAAHTIWMTTPQGFDVDATMECTLTSGKNIELSSTSGEAKLSGKLGATVESASGPLMLRGMQDVQLTSESGTMTLTTPGDIFVASRAHGVSIRGATGVAVAAPSGPIFLNTGQEITLNASTSITLRVGMSSITLTPKGIEISAPQITSTATGFHTIGGAMIKLN